MRAQYGILGRKLGHTYSPQIHAELGDYDYKIYEVEPEQLEALLRTTPCRGFNVTIPYKKAVIAHCAALSPAAQALGSVNTLVRQPDGSWYGDNTDYYGFCYMVKRSSIDVRGRSALVLGNGGVCPTVCHALRELGAGQVTVISRSGPNNYENLDHSAQLIANTTPVGMYPNNGAAPVQVAGFPRCEGVLDLIYNPGRTQLMLDAEACGIPAAGGLSMLVAQAKRAAELFTGRDIADSEIDRITRKMEGQMRNLVLIGMPGCGKSSIGRLLAQRLGRPFVDADEALEQRLGITIPELFRTKGEAVFRAEERRTLAELGKRSGYVIAAGGGALMQPGNPALLRQNGRLIWLRRPLELLPVDGRPVSQRTDLRTLYAQRRQTYADCADFTVDNTGTPEQAAEAIEEWLK